MVIVMKKTKLILLLTIIMSIFISIYSVNYAHDDPNATTTQNDAET